MGCGISKLNLEETRPGYQIRTLRRRSDVKDREDETDSLTSKQRKSTSSMTSEDGSRDGGFLKRVIGSNEKEKDVERELQPGHHGRKSSVSSSPRKDLISVSRFKQSHVETMDKDAPKEKKSLNKDREASNNNEDEYIRPSNAEECAASILFSPGSPSFRVYCVNDFPYEDNGEEEGEENKSKNTGTDKGSETLPAKRGRKGRGFRTAMHMGGSTRGLRSVLQRGGSAGMKNILNGTSCRSQTSSPPHDSTTKLIAKAV
ncbi:hypothetical protein P3X46_033686 [Hevea brasiliensis]|uniref:Uncharacterized protein n=1 Tax=Hevea brasiliensis TaxID=3981 RepID=A0ABQ9KC18_HEVBR|nr:uncharacterized protein LOC131176302 [Hevea brasiliensis]KAJ9132860.1 hypothetical protein P3X46_033686 [Hevea brasiliensis]